jgi:hypothetical protein
MGEYGNVSAVVTRTIDLSHALVADLSRGRLESTRPPVRLVALPASWLGELLDQVPEAGTRLARTWAAPLAQDARVVLGEDEPSPEAMAYALSCALAVRGLGTVQLERWGDALVLRWMDPPCHGPVFAALGADLLARVVGELMDVPTHGASLGSAEESFLRVLLGSASACALARELGARGASLPAVLDALAPGGAP